MNRHLKASSSCVKLFRARPPGRQLWRRPAPPRKAGGDVITHLGRDTGERRNPGRRHLCNSVTTHTRGPGDIWDPSVHLQGELISQGAVVCHVSQLPRFGTRAPNYWLKRKAISKGKLYRKHEKEDFLQGTRRADSVILWSENNYILITGMSSLNKYVALLRLRWCFLYPPWVPETSRGRGLSLNWKR